MKEFGFLVRVDVYDRNGRTTEHSEQFFEDTVEGMRDAEKAYKAAVDHANEADHTAGVALYTIYEGKETPDKAIVVNPLTVYVVKEGKVSIHKRA